MTSNEKTSSSPVFTMLEVLRKKQKTLVAQLRPGASAEALAGLCALGVPDRFLELYAAHDGVEGEEFLAEFGLLPVQQILSERDTMNGLLGEKPRWREVTWWHERWVPFLADHDGQFYCLDPVGTLEGGRPGQIVFFDHERGPNVEFTSFDVFVDLVTALAKKGVLLERDDDQFSGLYDDALGAGTAQMPSKEKKAALKRISALERDEKHAEALDVALPLARQYSADKEIWWSITMLSARLEQWEVMAQAAAAVVRLEKPDKRYTYLPSLGEALHRLGRDDEALAHLGRYLRTRRDESECSMATPFRGNYEYFPKHPEKAAFRERCLVLWTEIHPSHLEAWWLLLQHTQDPVVRRRAAERTVELCTDARARFNDWVITRREAAQAILAEG